MKWQTGFFWKELTEDTPDENKAVVAQEFVELEVDREAFGLGRTDIDVLTCTIHPDHIERCEGIDFAGILRVNEEAEERRNPLEQTFTVCGMLAETGQCYSGLWSAHGPVMAATAAWGWYKCDGEATLLISCVHEGIVNKAPWTPAYADASCKDDRAMAARMAELAPKGL
jgi:hypothetical protein